MSTNILVVEDDAIQRSLLTQLLAGQGHAVEGATDGFDALRQLRRRHFDVVLMDYGLPDLSGLAAAQLIAGLAPEAGRPRLIGLSMTPEKMRDQVAEAATLFDHVLAKSCSPTDLLAAVAAVRARAPEPGHPPAAPGLAGSSLPPIRPAPHPATRPVHGQVPPEDPAAAPIRVLLVDDDATVRSVVEASLLAQGFSVETASDGLEAVQKLSWTRYEVVVLDIMMPGVDGLAAARLAFQLLSRADRPRLVALTSTPDELRAREAGTPSLFDAVIPKSADTTRLGAALRLCADYRLRRAPLAPLAFGDVARLAKLLGRRP